MSKEFFEQFPTIMGLDCTKEVIGEYQKADKYKLDYRLDFVMTYYPIAIEAGKRYGIHPLMLLAQASVESTWGTTELSKKCFNFFALIADSENEYWDGKIFTTEKGHKIKVYENARQSFFDYARLLKEKYPYAAQVSNSIIQYADSIANSPSLPFKGKDKMLITKYRTLIIRSAISILTIAKVCFASHYN